MVNIAWVVPSLGVFNNSQGDLVIEKPLSFIDLEALPNNFSFNVSFGIINLEEHRQYKLNFQIIDPEQKVIFDIDVEIDHQRLIKDNPDKNLIMYLNQMQISIILNSKRRSLYYQIVYRYAEAQSNFNVNLVS